MSEIRACLYCRWWRPLNFDDSSGACPDLDTVGQCHLNPPHIVQIGNFHDGMNSVTAWPRAQGFNFCGKFTGRRDDHASSDTSGDRNTSAPRETVVEPKSFDNWTTIGDLSVNILGRREDAD